MGFSKLEKTLKTLLFDPFHLCTISPRHYIYISSKKKYTFPSCVYQSYFDVTMHLSHIMTPHIPAQFPVSKPHLFMKGKVLKLQFHCEFDIIYQSILLYIHQQQIFKTHQFHAIFRDLSIIFFYPCPHLLL